MSKVRVHNLSMSLDGFAAGPDQSLENALGVGGEQLHEWVFETRSGGRMVGNEGGTTGVDDEFWLAGDIGIGATIMGRNMFGPIRGEWGDDDWKGWWGENPPYHHPVFVITHHPHEPIPMEGGTTFHFVGDIRTALDLARDAAGDQDIRIGGGMSVIRQYLRAGLIDEMHVPVVPILLGGGERLFPDELEGYEVSELVQSPAVAHFRIVKKASQGS
jgi:dihydrofolate reductase